MSDKSVSTGEVVLIVLAAIALVPIVAGWIRNWTPVYRVLFRPKMGSRHYLQRSLRIGTGLQIITLRIASRVAGEISRANFQFVELDWLGRPRKAPFAAIQIIGMTSFQWRDPPPKPANVKTNFRTNLLGGIDIHIPGSHVWPVGEFLYAELRIKAHKKWSGYLSFEGVTDARRRGRGRLSVA